VLSSDEPDGSTLIGARAEALDDPRTLFVGHSCDSGGGYVGACPTCIRRRNALESKYATYVLE
jgi:hypothetical protein